MIKKKHYLFFFLPKSENFVSEIQIRQPKWALVLDFGLCIWMLVRAHLIVMELETKFHLQFGQVEIPISLLLKFQIFL
jgi:hypothetical protein